MKSKNMYYILLISLAFNLGFLIMLAYHVFMEPKTMMPPPKHNQKVHRVFKDENMARLRKENMQLRMEFFEELAKAEIDTVSVKDMMNKLDESQRVLEHSVLKHFVTAREGMTDEEAQEFFGGFKERYEKFNKNKKHEDRRKQ